MVAKVRIMGAAVGTIMAVIITAHIRNISRKSTPVQARTWVRARLIPPGIDPAFMPWLISCRMSQAR